ncbi:MAG TPA: sigma-70 family RNA polymerase sigma factor [Gemmatimonadales bacterium]|nr:sigma-70 family RNA polymerase sigma factor [Gemmatimonadales bacterium]
MASPQSAAATDADLIARWRGADERAATELVLRHGTPLARFLAASGAQQEDLDDLVQETFLRAFRSIAGFRGQCQFRTWLLTIGSNVLKDEGRRAAKRKVVPLDETLQASGGSPHEEAVAWEAEARLREALTDLPRLQREVFLLRAQQGMEYEEIASALDTTPGAARVHYHHAVKRLKERLQ